LSDSGPGLEVSFLTADSVVSAPLSVIAMSEAG
jgi:hypothetical protein